MLCPPEIKYYSPPKAGNNEFIMSLARFAENMAFYMKIALSYPQLRFITGIHISDKVFFRSS
jgi:hypothetical protein